MKSKKKDLQVDLSTYQNDFTFYNKIYRFVWALVYILLFRPFSLKAFKKWRVFLLNLFGAKIHSSVLIFSNVKIWAPYNLEMEKYSCMGAGVDCYNQGKIVIKANAVISQKCYLCASSHDIYDSAHPLIFAPILIEDQAWVAADVFIGPGVIVGQGAVVGARASVFRNVDPWTVVGGNPAVFLKKRELKK